MTGVVDFHGDLDTQERAILLHGSYIFGAVLLRRFIDSLGHQVWQSGNLEWPRLRIRDVPVQPVHLVV